LTTQPETPVTPSTSLDLNPNPQSSPSRGIAKAVPKPKPMSVSPRKAKKEFSKPESEWRQSDIPEDVEITKGNAQKDIQGNERYAFDSSPSHLSCGSLLSSLLRSSCL
jgi:hypothetical protein